MWNLIVTTVWVQCKPCICMTEHWLHSYQWDTILGMMAQRLRKFCNCLSFTELIWVWDGPAAQAFDSEAQACTQYIGVDSFWYTYLFRDNAQISRRKLTCTVRSSRVNGLSSFLAISWLHLQHPGQGSPYNSSLWETGWLYRFSIQTN